MKPVIQWDTIKYILRLKERKACVNLPFHSQLHTFGYVGLLKPLLVVSKPSETKSYLEIKTTMRIVLSPSNTCGLVMQWRNLDVYIEGDEKHIDKNYSW